MSTEQTDKITSFPFQFEICIYLHFEIFTIFVYLLLFDAQVSVKLSWTNFEQSLSAGDLFKFYFSFSIRFNKNKENRKLIETCNEYDE